MSSQQSNIYHHFDLKKHDSQNYFQALKKILTIKFVDTLMELLHLSSLMLYTCKNVMRTKRTLNINIWFVDPSGQQKRWYESLS